jgi:type VI secretion system secreted protein Hcp
MAMKLFLKLDDVDGGSTAVKYEKWIEISSFSWGATQSAAAGGGAGAGKLTVKTVDVNVHSGIATPGMIKLLGSGKRTNGQIVVASSQKGLVGQFKYHTIKLTGVRIESYAMGAAGTDATPTDAVSLSFLKLEIHTAIGKLTADATLDTLLKLA